MGIYLLTVDDYGEHLLGKFGELVVGFLVVGLPALRNLAFRVYYKYLANWNTNVHITDGIRLAIAKPTVKRCLICGKQFLDVL